MAHVFTFFREDSAPAPDEIIQRNIEAIMDDKRDDFAQYQGRLHGYPDCCIEYFSSYNRTRDAAPEVEAVEPLTNAINNDIIQDDSNSSTSIEEFFEEIFEIPDIYAFFAREFYPEPGCNQARQQGISIYDVLCDGCPEELVNDFFKVNVGGVIKWHITFHPRLKYRRNHHLIYLVMNIFYFTYHLYQCYLI